MNYNNTELIKRILIGNTSDLLREKFFNNSLNENEIKEILNLPINEDRLTGKDWPNNAETMIGYERMTNLEFCISKIYEEKIDGDIIETGVWQGGACIFMKWLINKLSLNKKIFVADSFEGLPLPNPEKYPNDTNDIHHTIDYLKVSVENVTSNFKKYNLLDENIVFLKGWFKDTLPQIKKDQKFSLIRLDGDMYESTMDGLTNLYPKLTSGGYIIIDDFCLKPCVQAVRDFRSINGINTEIKHIDFTGVFWKKE